MAWWNPVSWFGGVQYRNEGGTHTYTLTDPAAGKFLSAFRGGHSEESYLTAFLSVPELFSCVDAIASRVMNGNFYVRRKSDGADVTHLKTHLKKLLDKPSVLVSGYDFRYLMVIYKIVCGNRYTYKQVTPLLSDSYLGVLSLFQLRPEVTDIKLKNPRPDYFSISDIRDYIDYYATSEDGRRKLIAPELVIHNTDLGLRLGNECLKGQSCLRPAEYPISNLCAVYEARNVIFTRRGPLGAIVSAKKDMLIGGVALTPSEKKETIEDLQNSYGLQHGKSPFAITGQPIDFKKFGASIAELQPYAETAADMYAIAGIIGVPRSVLPSEKGTTFTNAQEEEIGLYFNRVIPEAQEICDVYNAILGLENEPFEIAVKFDHVQVLQKDRVKSAQADKYEMETATMKYDKGLITKNQFRQEVGEEKVEGEDYYVTDDPVKNMQNEKQSTRLTQQSSAN